MEIVLMSASVGAIVGLLCFAIGFVTHLYIARAREQYMTDRWRQEHEREQGKS